MKERGSSKTMTQEERLDSGHQTNKTVYDQVSGDGSDAANAKVSAKNSEKNSKLPIQKQKIDRQTNQSNKSAIRKASGSGNGKVSTIIDRERPCDRNNTKNHNRKISQTKNRPIVGNKSDRAGGASVDVDKTDTEMTVITPPTNDSLRDSIRSDICGDNDKHTSSEVAANDQVDRDKGGIGFRDSEKIPTAINTDLQGDGANSGTGPTNENNNHSNQNINVTEKRDTREDHSEVSKENINTCDDREKPVQASGSASASAKEGSCLQPLPNTDDPVLRLNALRANISNALKEVKAVLDKHAPPPEVYGETTQPNPEEEEGCVKFRFVRRVRKKSVIKFDEEEIVCNVPDPLQDASSGEQENNKQNNQTNVSKQSAETFDEKTKYDSLENGQDKRGVTKKPTAIALEPAKLHETEKRPLTTKMETLTEKPKIDSMKSKLPLTGNKKKTDKPGILKDEPQDDKNNENIRDPGLNEVEKSPSPKLDKSKRNVRNQILKKQTSPHRLPLPKVVESNMQQGLIESSEQVEEIPEAKSTYKNSVVQKSTSPEMPTDQVTGKVSTKIKSEEPIQLDQTCTKLVTKQKSQACAKKDSEKSNEDSKKTDRVSSTSTVEKPQANKNRIKSSNDDSKEMMKASNENGARTVKHQDEIKNKIEASPTFENKNDPLKRISQPTNAKPLESPANLKPNKELARKSKTERPSKTLLTDVAGLAHTTVPDLQTSKKEKMNLNAEGNLTGSPTILKSTGEIIQKPKVKATEIVNTHFVDQRETASNEQSPACKPIQKTSNLQKGAREPVKLQNESIKRQRPERCVSVEEKAKEILSRTSKSPEVKATSKETITKKSSVNDTSADSTPGKESSPNGSPVKEFTNKKGPIKEPQAKTSPIKECSVKDSPVKQSLVKESPKESPKETLVKELPVEGSAVKVPPMKKSPSPIFVQKSIEKTSINTSPIKTSPTNDSSKNVSLVRPPVKDILIKEPLEEHPVKKTLTHPFPPKGSTAKFGRAFSSKDTLIEEPLQEVQIGKKIPTKTFPLKEPAAEKPLIAEPPKKQTLVKTKETDFVEKMTPTIELPKAQPLIEKPKIVEQISMENIKPMSTVLNQDVSRSKGDATKVKEIGKPPLGEPSLQEKSSKDLTTTTTRKELPADKGITPKPSMPTLRIKRASLTESLSSSSSIPKLTTPKRASIGSESDLFKISIKSSVPLKTLEAIKSLNEKPTITKRWSKDRDVSDAQLARPTNTTVSPIVQTTTANEAPTNTTSKGDSTLLKIPANSDATTSVSSSPSSLPLAKIESSAAETIQTALNIINATITQPIPIESVVDAKTETGRSQKTLDVIKPLISSPDKLVSSESVGLSNKSNAIVESPSEMTVVKKEVVPAMAPKQSLDELSARLKSSEHFSEPIKDNLDVITNISIKSETDKNQVFVKTNDNQSFIKVIQTNVQNGEVELSDIKEAPALQKIRETDSAPKVQQIESRKESKLRDQALLHQRSVENETTAPVQNQLKREGSIDKSKTLEAIKIDETKDSVNSAKDDTNAPSLLACTSKAEPIEPSLEKEYIPNSITSAEDPALIETTTSEPESQSTENEPSTAKIVRKKPKKTKKVIIKRVKRRLSVADSVDDKTEVCEKPIAELDQVQDESEEPVAEELPVPKGPKSCLVRRSYDPGDAVMYAERVKKTSVKWRKATVIDKITDISYKLCFEDGTEKPAHISYIKKFTEKKVQFGGKEYLEIDYQAYESSSEEEEYNIWARV